MNRGRNTGEAPGIVDGAGHADTQALLHRHGPRCFQPVIPILSQGPCGEPRISRARAPPTPAPPSTHPPTEVAAAAAAACLSRRVSGRPCVKREGKGEGGMAAGRPMGSWGGARNCSQKRNFRAGAPPPPHTADRTPLGPETPETCPERNRQAGDPCPDPHLGLVPPAPELGPVKTPRAGTQVAS